MAIPATARAVHVESADGVASAATAHAPRVPGDPRACDGPGGAEGTPWPDATEDVVVDVCAVHVSLHQPPAAEPFILSQRG
jgi:hypothetical protein